MDTPFPKEQKNGVPAKADTPLQSQQLITADRELREVAEATGECGGNSVPG